MSLILKKIAESTTNGREVYDSAALDFVPVMTTAGGSCLTAQNWQETGVRSICYYLDALLIKPGFSYLTQLPDWDKYTGWQGDWVLNATMPKIDKDGYYVFRSSYDGALVSCAMQDIVQVILHLKPKRVILPIGFEVESDEVWQALLDVAELFVSEKEQARYIQRQVTGLYYVLESSEDVVVLNNHPADLACYVASKVDPYLLIRLLAGRQIIIESDIPAKEACDGIVYTVQGSIDLREACYALQFELLDSTCSCPTCAQHLTRAYLHHLLAHTPLLCQRLLVQHNIYFLANNALHALSVV